VGPVVSADRASPRRDQESCMKKVIQTIMVVPISETIGKTFGSNTLLGTGAAIVAARFVLRSFGGMLALGVLAGGLNYVQRRLEAERAGAPTPVAAEVEDKPVRKRTAKTTA
jgi:hypothetical protein